MATTSLQNRQAPRAFPRHLFPYRSRYPSIPKARGPTRPNKPLQLPSSPARNPCDISMPEKKKRKHTHQSSSSRRRSSSSQHAGESSSPSQEVSAQSPAQSLAQSLAAEHYNLRQLDDVRHQTGFQLTPRATQQQFNRGLQRREDDFYGRYEQYTAERGQQLALAQGPFAPGQVYEHIYSSRWEGPAENKAFGQDEVSYSGWWEQQQDEEGDGHGDGREDQGARKKNKDKKRDGRRSGR